MPTSFARSGFVQNDVNATGEVWQPLRAGDGAAGWGNALMSTNRYESAGRLDLCEGYRLTWGPRGLIVEVTDYHAKSIGLPWSLLRELADAAQHGTDDRDPS